MTRIEAGLRRLLALAAIAAAFGVGGAVGLATFLRYDAAPVAVAEADLAPMQPLADEAFVVMARAALAPGDKAGNR